MIRVRAARGELLRRGRGLLDAERRQFGILDARVHPGFAEMQIEVALTMAEQEHAESFGNRAATFVNQPLTPFHIAVQVRDIAEARRFYKDILGCAEGRSDPCWVDFNLYGHQFVCHLNPGLGASGKLESHFNFVDGHGVPVPHCGVVLRPAQWLELAERVRRAGVEFVIEPHTRFQGQAGEQSTMFFLDPSGNALEFKAFQNIESQLFAADQAAR